MAITFNGKKRATSGKFRDSARLRSTWQAFVIKNGKIACLGHVQAYASASFNTWYACIWLAGGYWGYGRASGYGYNRKGAAIRSALKNAGVEGAPNAEAGEADALRAVFAALAETLGYDAETLYLDGSHA